MPNQRPARTAATSFRDDIIANIELELSILSRDIEGYEWLYPVVKSQLARFYQRVSDWAHGDCETCPPPSPPSIDEKLAAAIPHPYHEDVYVSPEWALSAYGRMLSPLLSLCDELQAEVCPDDASEARGCPSEPATGPEESGKQRPAPDQGQKKKSKPATVNQRMAVAVQSHPDRIQWTARQWAEHLDCSKTAVTDTDTWKRTIRTFRQLEAANSKLAQPRE